MGWPAGITVAIPTIPQREEVLAGSLAGWQALGAEPVTACQPAGWQACPASQSRTAVTAIRAALDAAPAATHVLYAEDDAGPSPLLAARLPALAATGEVVALWSSATTFLPARIRRAVRAGEPLPRHEAVPATGLARWFGSVAILIPASDATAVTAWQPLLPGFDMHLRAWLLASGARLLIAVPFLAQHKRGKRYATRGGPAVVESATFGWPVLEGPC